MIGIIYRKIIKPTVFLFPADKVHDFFVKQGRFLGKSNFLKYIIKKLFSYNNKILETKVSGMNFSNPIGLAAGFDYDADLIEILPSVGFGFQTIGTITLLPYEGNAKPMLGRLPKSRSLLVNKGFKNRGIEAILTKVNKKNKTIPLGISIGSTNQPYKKIEDMIEDVCHSFERALKENYFDYFELNISCPNLINVENLKDKFDQPLGFGMLLNKLSYLNINKPLFVKMYLEKSVEETLALCDVAVPYSWISGFIFSNLVKNRNNPKFDKEEIAMAGRGNFSGKPTQDLTDNLISEVYKKYKERFIIIGCGGVFTAKDAYEKIKRGASLIQMITGMIYEGPQRIGEINRDLSELLKEDGYKSVSEAVGSRKD